MTGTACDISVYREYDANQDNLNLFSAWLFGKINAEYLLDSINTDGCTIRVPVDHHVPDREIKLLIMSPDNENRVHSIFCMQLDSFVEHYSNEYRRVNFRFVCKEPELIHEVNLLAMYLAKGEDAPLKGSLLNLAR